MVIGLLKAVLMQKATIACSKSGVKRGKGRQGEIPRLGIYQL